MPKSDGKWLLLRRTRTPAAGGPRRLTKREAYDKYEDHLKLNLEQRAKFEAGVAMMIDALRDAGVKWSDGTPHAPMTDVDQLTLYFRANGDFRLRDVTIWSYGGCGAGLCFEPHPSEENEYDKDDEDDEQAEGAENA